MGPAFTACAPLGRFLLLSEKYSSRASPVHHGLRPACPGRPRAHHHRRDDRVSLRLAAPPLGRNAPRGRIQQCHPLLPLRLEPDPHHLRPGRHIPVSYTHLTLPTSDLV